MAEAQGDQSTFSQTEKTSSRYTVVSRYDDEYTRRHKEFVVTDPTTYASETPHTPERQAQISAVGNAVIRWGKDTLAIDMAARIPSFDRIHFLSPEAFQELVVKSKNMSDGAGGLITLDDHIFVKEEEPITKSLAYLGHELVHAVSFSTFISMSRQPNQLFHQALSQKNGLLEHDLTQRKNREFHLLDEAVTEHINQLVIQNYWQQEQLLRDLPPIQLETGYEPHIILLKDLLEHCAAKIRSSNPAGTKMYGGVDMDSQPIQYVSDKITANDILVQLAKQKIHGRNKYSAGLNLIEKGIGRDGIDHLKSMSIINAASTAKSLGLYPTARKIESWQAARGVIGF